MNAVKYRNRVVGKLCWLAAWALLWPAITVHAAVEEKFDVLQIGTHTYKNVTVTTKAKDYIFILHSAGMTNLKVRDLPSELREQLGYAPASAPVAKKPALAWVKNSTGELGKRELSQLEERWRSLGAERQALQARLTLRLLAVMAGVMLLLYLFFCYCCAAICRKAGHPPGVLVWLPVLQLVPLLRAAGMSRWWLLACLVPVLNVVAHVVWSFKIAQARGKSPVLGLFLLLPGTNLAAFLYLAFSDAAPPKERPVVEVMTLDAA